MPTKATIVPRMANLPCGFVSNIVGMKSAFGHTRLQLLFLHLKRRRPLELLDLLRVAVEDLVPGRLLVASQEVEDAQLVADVVLGGDDPAMIDAGVGIFF